MSRERELLEELSTKDMVSYYYPNLIDRIKELLAEPEQEPLSDEEMFHHWLYLEEVSPYLNFTAGVRYAEEQHGIGAEG